MAKKFIYLFFIHFSFLFSYLFRYEVFKFIVFHHFVSY
nr:MAG TPA: hypothetical protein [Caudoviricetes sp.]